MHYTIVTITTGDPSFTLSLSLARAALAALSLADPLATVYAETAYTIGRWDGVDEHSYVTVARVRTASLPVLRSTLAYLCSAYGQQAIGLICSPSMLADPLADATLVLPLDVTA